MKYRTITCKSVVTIEKQPISFTDLCKVNEDNLMTQDKIRPVRIKGCAYYKERNTIHLTEKQKFLSRNMHSMIGWVVMFSGSNKIGGIDEVQCEDFVQKIVDKQIYVENIEKLENYFKFNVVEVDGEMDVPEETSFEIKITETLYNKLESIEAHIEDIELDIEELQEYNKHPKKFNTDKIKYKVKLADGTCGWYTEGYIMKVL